MENAPKREEIKSFLEDTFKTMDAVLTEQHAELRTSEVGVVKYVGYGIVRVGGLPHIRAEELVLFPEEASGTGVQHRPRRDRGHPAGRRRTICMRERR